MAIGDLALITDHISMINKSFDGILSFDEQLFKSVNVKKYKQIRARIENHIE